MLFIDIKLHFQVRLLHSMFILKTPLQVSEKKNKSWNMITWLQTLEEGTIQPQVNSQPQWMEIISSAGHTWSKKEGICYIGWLDNGRQIVWSAIHDQTATWLSATAHLVIQMKKGSEFWTPSTAGYACYMNHYNTFLTGYKISD